MEVLKEALKSPVKQILTNAGIDYKGVIKKYFDKGVIGYGYNVITDEFVNMTDAGIIDPAKVSKYALINAASAAGMFITTEASISVRKFMEGFLMGYIMS